MADPALEEQIKALGSLTAQRFADQQRAVEAALISQEKAVAAALAAQVKAVETALAAVDEQNHNHAAAHEQQHQSQALALEKMERRIDEKFHDHNRFREQIESERLSYVRRDMLDVIERNTRTMIEKLDSDSRARLEKSEADLRIRIDAEIAARLAAMSPILAWQQRSGGQMGVWVAIGGVIVTVVISAVIFLANYLTK